MSLPISFPFPHKSSSSLATLNVGVKVCTEANTNTLQLESTKDRIRKLFDNVQISVSSYDTAWVALVPSPTSPKIPCFPDCVDWLLDNQQSDGSWGLLNNDRLLVKDALSSTLASILALKRWGVGKEQINKGLYFIESNNSSVVDENQHSPIGFDIIFTRMVKYAEDFDLTIPIEPPLLDAMLRRRKLELKRAYFEGRKSHLAYISEGVGKSQDWDMVMKYQRKNGSLFNSPSATAAAYMHLKDARCLNYLNTLLAKFGNAVPTVYPSDIFVRLCMVDNLENLGIGRHFKKEITNVLDETYRCWLEEEEEIFSDTVTCAMAFRLLRLNGYDVSSEHIKGMTKEDLKLGSNCQNDVMSALELYRATEIIIHPEESALEKQNLWCGQFLEEKLYNDAENNDKLGIMREVEDAIKLPFYATLDRIASRRTIENYSIDSMHILKTSYCSPNIRNKDYLKLAVEDFNELQSVHREELKSLERWSEDNRLGKLKFARQKVLYCYYAAAATFPSPELYDARMSCTKNGVLTTVVDDFYDAGGSMEELENLTQLIQKWDIDVAVDCCSEDVEILFSAVHSTMCELGAKAFKFQGRNVTSHLKELWVDTVDTMMKEAKWAKEKFVPEMDEYVNNGCVSFALHLVILPSLYFLGPKLPEKVVYGTEYQKMAELMGNIGRLLNDIASFERESNAGQLNALSLLMFHGNKSVSKAEACEEIKSYVATQRRELLKLVLQKRGSVVPKACKEYCWKIIKILHSFYREADGYTSEDLTKTAKALIYEPVSFTV